MHGASCSSFECPLFCPFGTERPLHSRREHLLQHAQQPYTQPKSGIFAVSHFYVNRAKKRSSN